MMIAKSQIKNKKHPRECFSLQKYYPPVKLLREWDENPFKTNIFPRWAFFDQHRRLWEKPEAPELIDGV